MPTPVAQTSSVAFTAAPAPSSDIEQDQLPENSPGTTSGPVRDQTENRRRRQILDAVGPLTHREEQKSKAQLAKSSAIRLISSTGILGPSIRHYYGTTKQLSRNLALNHEKEMFVDGRPSDKTAVDDLLKTVRSYIDDLAKKKKMSKGVTETTVRNLRKKYSGDSALHFISSSEGGRFNKTDDISLAADLVRMKQGGILNLPEFLDPIQQARFQEKYPYLSLKGGKTQLNNGSYGIIRLAVPLPGADDFVIVKISHFGQGRSAAARRKYSKNELEKFDYLAAHIPGFADFYGTALFEDCAILAMPFEPLGDAHFLFANLDKLELPSNEKKAMINRCAREIGHELRKFHALGIKHHDLQPCNILISLDGSVKLRDLNFSTNKNAVQEYLRTGHVLGTPGYIPPPHKNRTALSLDLYAYGAVLHMAVTGSQTEKEFGGVSKETDLQGLKGDPVGELSRRLLAADPNDQPSLDDILANTPCLNSEGNGSDQYMPADQFVQNIIRLHEIENAERQRSA
jgi:hypothetical protein